MADLKWTGTPEGGARLKTRSLHLDVRPRAGGGYECIVYNFGRYTALSRSAYPISGDLQNAKAYGLTLARKVLADELAALENL